MKKKLYESPKVREFQTGNVLTLTDSAEIDGGGVLSGSFNDENFDNANWN